MRSDPAGRPRVAVIVLNWNAAALTTQCVESVLKSHGVTLEVCVIDNASSDGSTELLERHFRDRHHVVALPENVGYSGGMNAGIRWWQETSCEYCLLLTQDVTVQPDTIAAVVKPMTEMPSVGIVAPLVQHGTGARAKTSAGGYVDRQRTRIGHLTAPLSQEPYPVDWVDGGCMLLRREAIRAVGGLDERYFMYYEENDLCHRMRRAGWQVVVAPKALAVHDTAEEPGPHYFYYMCRNRYLFWRDHFAQGVARVAAAQLLDSARMAVGVARTLLTPSRWQRLSGQWEMLQRQIAGVSWGTYHLVRGRFGRQRF